MPLVKLNATSSTNDFLKEMAGQQDTENFTVVTAESQTKGRGQMGSVWVSEPGKNLMMSILIKEVVADIHQVFDLNVAVALAVTDALEKHDIPDLSIKWPNDIMAGTKKIGGILIENVFKSDGSVVSVAGIGLNINQNDFSGLPKASSLSAVTGRVFDKDMIREKITENIKANAAFIAEHSDVLWKIYHSRLFKAGVPMPFEDQKGNRFMGIIEGVNRDGQLKLRTEDDVIHHFGIKEVQMLY